MTSDSRIIVAVAYKSLQSQFIMKLSLLAKKLGQNVLCGWIQIFICSPCKYSDKVLNISSWNYHIEKKMIPAEVCLSALFKYKRADMKMISSTDKKIKPFTLHCRALPGKKERKRLV